jgi:hypothetical protein
MKKTAFAIVLLISKLAFSQRTEELGTFSKVTAFDKIDVFLIPSDENKIILDGDNSESVQLIIKNGELKIRLPLGKLLEGDNISATLYFKEIDAVEANEGSRIACEKPFKTTSFDVIAKEGSEINILIDVEKLNVKGNSGASITIDGTAENQDILLNSGALYYGSKLITKQTTITVNAGGDADVYATNLVDAKVRAGGLITIFGKPKQINQQTFAGGKIEEVK